MDENQGCWARNKLRYALMGCISRGDIDERSENIAVVTSAGLQPQ